MMNNQFNRFSQMMQPQDIGGISPVFQNIGNQQAMLNSAMQQGQNLTQQAGQTGQQSGSGMNPLMMAMMLRGGQSSKYLNSIPAIIKYGASNVYGGFGQGQVPTTTTGEN
jgi:hypothetical protein